MLNLHKLITINFQLQTFRLQKKTPNNSKRRLKIMGKFKFKIKKNNATYF